MFEQILDAVSNRKLLIVSVFLLVVSSGMAATFLITPKYEAKMSILVSRDRVLPQISLSEKISDADQKEISDEEFNSELELIKSSEVITGVVKDLNLINNQAPKNDSWASELRIKIKAALYDSPRRASAQSGESGNSINENSEKNQFTIEKAVNRVSGNLDVVPIKKSRVIKISYTDTDPIRAKNTLDKLYQKYVDLHVRLNEKLQAGEIFNEQSDEFNRKLKSSTNRLKNFDVQNEISGTEIGVQRELLLKQLYEARTQLNTTQAEIVETQKRIADLQEKVNDQPEEIQTGSVSKYVSAIDRMKEELVQLEQQKIQLLQKYKPNSRPVRENEGRIQQLKKSLAEETANPPQEKSFALNDLRRKLVNELFTSQTNLAALKEREKKLSPLVASLRQQSTILNSKSIERSSIDREKTVNEEAYLLYQKKARENEISQVLSKEQAVNFSLVDPPRTDGEPKNPKPLLNLLVLMFVGATAGFAGALVLNKLAAANYENHLIVSSHEIEQRWSLPVIASIPVIPELDAVYSASKFERRLLPPTFENEEKNNPR